MVPGRLTFKATLLDRQTDAGQNPIHRFFPQLSQHKEHHMTGCCAHESCAARQEEILHVCLKSPHMPAIQEEADKQDANFISCMSCSHQARLVG